MKVDKVYRWAGFVIAAGAIMRLFDHPQGNLIFTIGFAFFFLIKLFHLLGPHNRPWQFIHSLDFVLILIAFIALLLRYQTYPYSKIVFPIALLAEAIVGFRIKLNNLVGAQNVSTGLRVIGKLLRSVKM